MPSIEQLTSGVRDFCLVLDQVTVAFFFESYFRPKLSGAFPEHHIDSLGNAAIESSLLSIRIINDFFTKSQFATDIKAFHYSGFPLPSEFLENQERIDINKHLAHLTTERADNFPKGWALYDMMRRTHNAAHAFLTFITSDEGEFYRPIDWDIASRIFMCEKLEPKIREFLTAKESKE